MNGRLKAFSLILSFSLMGCVTTRQIHLYIQKIPRPTSFRPKNSFRYADLNDTLFVKPRYSGDMGMIFDVFYQLRDSLPDGRYKIFVNDKLRQIAIFKNKQRNGKSAFYDADGTHSIVPYKNGHVFGMSQYFYANGRVKSKEFHYTNFAFVYSSYYEDGRVINQFIVNNIMVRKETYDLDGTSFKVYDTDYAVKNHLVLTEHTGKLDGKKQYIYREGKFNVTYKNNEMINCMWTTTATH